MNLNSEDKNEIEFLEDLNKLIDNKKKETLHPIPKPLRLLKLGTSIAPQGAKNYLMKPSLMGNNK
jgi:hypothetical protein